MMRWIKSYRVYISLLTAVGALAFVSIASAGVHTWDVNEVFSNADGSIQFVELWEANGTPGETGVGNGTVTSNTNTLNMSNGPVASPTTNKHYLLGTQAFADLPGAPQPDQIIPAGMIPFFNTAGDTVAFGGFDSWAFGAVPTDGVTSLSRLTGQGANTPTNYNGDTATVDANPPSGLPLTSGPTTILIMALLTAAGFGLLWTRRSATE